jgi:hypothetical protein
MAGVKTVNAIRLLLNSVIDYAGLFPPAGLSMSEAIRNYADYHGNEFSWALGRFIVPVSRLAELESCIGDQTPDWRLSVLAGDNLESDLDKIVEFNNRHSPLVIKAVEVKAVDICAIDLALKTFDDRLETFLEIPTDKDSSLLIAAIAGSAHAKVRTGGTQPEMFPSPAELAKFMSNCAGCRVPFKATAGLHHALRSVYPLTYEDRSPEGRMHGFINLLVASAFAYAGADSEKLEAILEDENSSCFNFDDEGLSWHTDRIGAGELREMRERFFLSFGSCSFLEPISEIKALRIL